VRLSERTMARLAHDIQARQVGGPPAFCSFCVGRHPIPSRRFGVGARSRRPLVAGGTRARHAKASGTFSGQGTPGSARSLNHLLLGSVSGVKQQ
jgi:hypothetical protein